MVYWYKIFRIIAFASLVYSMYFYHIGNMNKFIYWMGLTLFMYLDSIYLKIEAVEQNVYIGLKQIQDKVNK